MIFSDINFKQIIEINIFSFFYKIYHYTLLCYKHYKIAKNAPIKHFWYNYQIFSILYKTLVLIRFMSKLPQLTTENLVFKREDWANFAQGIQPLNHSIDISSCLGFNEPLDFAEYNDFYGPLLQVINSVVEPLVAFAHNLSHDSCSLVKRPCFILGITGSVAAGKSTFTRILRKLLEEHFPNLKIEFVNTDGFIYPLKYLTENNLLSRKGFPESYNTQALIDFLSRVKLGLKATAPIYSHVTYDIVPDQQLEIKQPDILLIEGLNILQTIGSPNDLQVKDFLDMSVYINAPTYYLRKWYIERFLSLRKNAFQDPESYFNKYANISDQEAQAIAEHIWTTINEVNLENYILPTLNSADAVINKDYYHHMESVLIPASSKLQRFFSK